MPSPLKQSSLDLFYILAFHFKIKFIISFLLFKSKFEDHWTFLAPSFYK